MMELMKSNRPEELPAAQQGNQPQWAVEIYGRFGDLVAFSRRFGPQVQNYCAGHMLDAVAKDLPTLARTVKTYGEEGTSALIGVHVTDAVISMGEDRDVDPADVRFIARAICQSERLRKLRLPTILGFFHLLKCGEFDIYGKVTPRKILEVLRKYAVTAEEQEARAEHELEKRAAAAKAAADSHIVVKRWEEIAPGLNATDDSIVSYVARQMREKNESKDQ